MNERETIETMSIADKKAFSKTAIRNVLILWGLCAGVAALFIPSYDFGTDGIVVWLVMCFLMLIAIICLSVLPKILYNRCGNVGSTIEEHGELE